MLNTTTKLSASHPSHSRRLSLASVRMISAILLVTIFPSTSRSEAPFAVDVIYGANTRDECKGGFATPDGGLVLFGETQRTDRRFTDAYFVEIDPQDRIMAEHTILRDGNDRVNRLIPTPDGGYLYCGADFDTISQYNGSIYYARASLVKLNSCFEVVWRRLYGNRTESTRFNDLLLMPDGRIVAVGEDYNNGGWMIVCDENGWATASILLRGHGELYQVLPYDDNHVITVEDGDEIRKMDLDGNTLWVAETQIDRTEATNLVETADGCFVKAYGYRNSYQISKIDRDGQLIFHRTGNWDESLQIDRLVVLENGDIIAMGAETFATFDSNGDFVNATNLRLYEGRDIEIDLKTSDLISFGEQLIWLGTASSSGGDFCCAKLDINANVTSYSRYGTPGGTKERGFGVIPLRDNLMGALVLSDVNRDARSWPVMILFNEQGDSLGVVALPNRDHSYRYINLIPSFPNPEMEQSGYFFSGVSIVDWQHLHRDLSLYDVDFNLQWTLQIEYQEAEVYKDSLYNDFWAERNGNLLLRKRETLYKVNHLGQMEDSVELNFHRIVGFAQPVPDVYAFLSDSNQHSEVSLFDSDLNIISTLSPDSAVYSTPLGIVSPSEGELFVCCQSVDRELRTAITLSKVSSEGVIRWRRQLNRFQHSANLSLRLLTDPVQGLFFCSPASIQRYSLEAEFLGRATVSNRENWWYPDSILDNFAVARSGGVWCAGVAGSDLRLAHLTLDSLTVPVTVRGDEGEPFLLPSNLELSCYPNPFNAVLTIRYEVSVGSETRLEVFALSGQCLKSLVNGTQRQGVHSVSFDARELPSGLYLIRLKTNSGSVTQKIVLQR